MKNCVYKEPYIVFAGTLSSYLYYPKEMGDGTPFWDAFLGMFYILE